MRVYLSLARVLVICALGMIAGLLGLEMLDRWCARQLADTDGQLETN